MRTIIYFVAATMLILAAVVPAYSFVTQTMGLVVRMLAGH